jgi:hypothetical protein
MYLDPERFLEGLFLAAGGIGVLFGLPMIASSYKGGMPLLFIAAAGAVFYLYDQGYIQL